MPVSRENNWEMGFAESGDYVIERGENGVSVRYGERTAGTKIALDIDNYQGGLEHAVTGMKATVAMRRALLGSWLPLPSMPRFLRTF